MKIKIVNVKQYKSKVKSLGAKADYVHLPIGPNTVINCVTDGKTIYVVDVMVTDYWMKISI